jgi:hypothetical protein
VVLGLLVRSGSERKPGSICVTSSPPQMDTLSVSRPSVDGLLSAG